MKYLSFNSGKSLDQEKLIFDEPLLLMMLVYFHYLILIIGPIIFGVAFFYVQLNFRNSILFPFSIVTLFLSFLLALFIFLQIRKSTRFRIIKGRENRIENMKYIENICNTNDWRILHTDNQSQVILIENSKIVYHSGRELYILYKENVIYLRCLTYSMHGLVNPFHWKSQRKIENIILEKLI